jgi:hypothetical protein
MSSQKKRHLRPQNGPRSFCNLSQWNRWVATNAHLDHSSPLGSNGLHCIKFLHQMGKLLLNMTLGEPLALMKKFLCFDDPIELDGLLESVLCFGVHDLINFFLVDAVRIEFLGANYSTVSKVSSRGGKYGRSSSTLNTGCKPKKG